MSLGEVLNTDLNEIGSRLRGAVAWWIGELRELAAPLLVDAKARRRLPVVQALADGGFKRRQPDGTLAPMTPGAARTRVILVAPDDVALTRILPAPMLSERDIRRSVALDLDRLTPFSAHAAYHGLVLLPPDAEGDRKRICLAVAPRDRIDALLQQAEAAQLEPVGLFAWPGQGPGPDLLPAVRAATGAAAVSRGAILGWAVVAALVVANVGVAVWRDSRDLGRLQAAAAAQRPVAAQIRRQRREAQQFRDDAVERVQALRTHDPLSVLGALSRSLPDDAYAKRLVWDGAVVQVSGARRNNVSVTAALQRDPLLAGVRNTDPNVSPGEDQFDVTAEVLRPPRSGLRP